MSDSLRDPLRNRWHQLMPSSPDTQSAVDWACGLFPPDIQTRGIARAYYDFLWVLAEMSRTIPGGFKGKKILDLGCGAGVLSLAMRHLGAQVTAVDRFSEYGDEHDNQMGFADSIVCRLRDHGLVPIHCDFMCEGLLEEPGGYDVVSMFAVIEHLHQSPRQIFARIRQLLKPGGHLVITTPNHAWIRTRLRLLFGRPANHPLRDWWQEEFFGHVREYTLPELRTMFEWSGFAPRLTTAGNWAHVSSRVPAKTPGEPDRWTTRFTLSSLERWTIAGSLALTMAWRSCRYTLLIIGQKPIELGRNGQVSADRQ